MKFSIVIPTLNEEKYIERTLKSIKKQDFSDNEIIVVDGGSTDNTVKIAEKYTDKVIIIKERGIALARNIGAKNANGEVIIFTDADTMLARNYLSEIKKSLSDKEIVCGATRFKAIEDSKINAVAVKATSGLARVYNLFGITRSPGFSTFIRKKIFDKIEGYDESLFMCEDHDLAIRAKKYGKFVILTKTFVKTSTRRIKKLGVTNLILLYAYAELTNIGPLRKYIKRKDIVYPTIQEASKTDPYKFLKMLFSDINDMNKNYVKNVNNKIKIFYMQYGYKGIKLQNILKSIRLRRKH